MERVVLFCTCWIGRDEQVVRYRRWLAYVKRFFKGKIVLVDDASDWRLLARLHLPIYEPDEKKIDNDILVIRFEEHLGRPVAGILPGWYRSFSFMSEFAVRFNIDRLVHIESDTFVLSRRLWRRLMTSEEWGSPYSNEMMGAETTIQTIPRRYIPELWDFWRAGKKFWYKLDLATATYIPEYALPIRKYWMDVRGGRFGENWWTKEIPMNLDYVANLGEVSGKNDANLQWKIDKFFERLGLSDGI